MLTSELRFNFKEAMRRKIPLLIQKFPGNDDYLPLTDRWEQFIDEYVIIEKQSLIIEKFSVNPPCALYNAAVENEIKNLLNHAILEYSQSRREALINDWSGDFEFLRNDYCCRGLFHGTTEYPSVEHAFQAEKTTDDIIKLKILYSANGRDARKLGRSIPLSPNWDSDKLQVMEKLLRIKFSEEYNPELMQKLLDTGDKDLMMSHPKDYFWGTGADGSGQNMLGQLLMRIRNDLKPQNKPIINLTISSIVNNANKDLDG